MLRRIDRDDDGADGSDDCTENDTTSARLDELLAEQSGGLEVQGATSGDVGEMLEVVESDTLDGVDKIAHSQLLDESPEVIGGTIVFRFRGFDVGHGWRC